MSRPYVIALLASSLALAACQNAGHSTATPKNAPPAVLLNQKSGSSLDDADKLKYQQAEKRAYTAAIGQQITWNNPNSGHSGTITPVADGYGNDGAYCREFQQIIIIDGQQQQGHGRACQQPDGSWKMAL